MSIKCNECNGHGYFDIEPSFIYGNKKSPCEKCNGTGQTDDPIAIKALEIAARIWCDQEMRQYAMDVDIATEIANSIEKFLRKEVIANV